MDSVSIYLRTPLHSYGGAEAHLPAGVLVVEGQLVDRNDSSIRIDAHRLLDDRGRVLLDETVTLVLPWAKVDHMLVIA